MIIFLFIAGIPWGFGSSLKSGLGCKVFTLGFGPA
jgi:hypothetical protein